MTTNTVSCEFRFSGLVAFAAHISFRTSRQADTVDALLLDVSQSTTTGLPIHTPTLEVPENAIANAPASDPDSALPQNFARKLAPSRVYLLTGQRVTLERPASASGGNVRGVKNAAAATAPPATVDVWRDLKFVPDLETVRGDGDGTLADAALEGQHPLVFAELALTSGSLEGRPPLIAGLANVKCGYFPLKQTGPVPAAHPQFLTDRVVFVSDAAPSLTIVLTPRAGGPPRRIELKPMSNTIPIEVCNENTTGQIAQNDSTHFAAFYDLIDRRLAEKKKLVPKPLGIVTNTPQDPPAFCPPGFLFRRP